MNKELKKVVQKVKAAQDQLEIVLKNKGWVDDIKKYAERQGKEAKKLLTSDVEKVKTFLEKERKELEKFQKQIPAEVQKIKKFVEGQRKEFERLMGRVAQPKAKKKRSASARKAKSAAPSESTPSSNASS